MAKATKPKVPKNDSTQLQAQEPAPTQSNDVQHLEAEEIKEMPEDAMALIPVDVRAQNEIKKYNISRSWIEEKKAAYKDLTIKDVNDKVGLKAVEDAWREVSKKRTGLENKRKEIKQPYLTIGQKIDEEAKDITKLLLEIETPLKNEIDRIAKIKSDELERIKQEAEKKLHERVRQLLDNGMKFDGDFYSIGESISMDVVTLKTMKDEAFDVLLNKVSEKNQELIKAENDRIAEEEAEKQRVEDQRLENERKQAELDQQAENNLSEKREMRRDLLEGLGFVQNQMKEYVFTLGKYYYIFEGKGSDIGMLSLDCFKEEFAHAKESIEKYRLQHEEDLLQQKKDDDKKAEDLRLENEQKHKVQLREQQMKDLFNITEKGLHYYSSIPAYEHLAEMKVMSNDVQSLSEESWNELIEVLKVEYSEYQESVTAHKNKLADIEEENRVAALDDVEKIGEWLKKIAVLFSECPKISNADVLLAYNNFDSDMATIMEKFVEHLEGLKKENI